jgi:EAL domain-containing protein (putative c-di-GMP-specific phosphodiesterase class I)
MICGAEALLRGHHPKHGIVSPAGLLPPAGDPLYRPLSHFVLRHAMADWMRLSEQQQPLKLAINVPVSVVHAPDFIDLVREILPRAAGFPGLVFEITEDEMIRDSDLIREAATQLGLYNVSMSIDDFGAAYSSLSRLKDLPFSELKIDRSFVANCATDKLNHSLCQVVTELGHRFDAKVCAEGVENAADLRALIDMGCDTAQGFLFARPLCFDDFLAHLRAPPDWSLFECRTRSAVA